jgi:hypothetical protein
MLSQFKRDHSNLLCRSGSRGWYRYSFNPYAAEVTAPATVVSTGTLAVGADITSVVTLNPFEGLDREVVAFYSERRMELAA